MIVMISGKQGSGKSSASDGLAKILEERSILNRVKRYRFADPLYKMHDAVRKILQEIGVTSYDFNNTDGNLLQMIGTDWGRNTVSKDMWIKAAQNRYETFVSVSSKLSTNYFIIDDLRMKNEFEAFNALRIRLECPEEVRKLRARKWRTNTTHQSETDLDDWVDKFDLIVNTEALSAEETLETIFNFVIDPDVYRDKFGVNKILAGEAGM